MCFVPEPWPAVPPRGDRKTRCPSCRPNRGNLRALWKSEGKDLGSFRCRGVRHVIFSRSLEDAESQPPGTEGIRAQARPPLPMGPLTAHVLRARGMGQNGPLEMRHTPCPVVRLWTAGANQPGSHSANPDTRVRDFASAAFCSVL